MNTIKQRRPKQKIEKSNDEFKQHERIIMNKRIAEINNVITKKCHTIWNQYLYFKNKPHTLQFNFVYHGLETYLKKCDDYKAEQHKDNKQKWWNNQKASEMSQQFLPSVLNSTDHMAQYLAKQIQSNLHPEFTNYITFELLESAITSVFSTQRSGSNEVFLRTSFQYAKAGLRKKLVSYFGDGELRNYDTKSRKKKDLWQRLIREKKEKLLQIFQHKKCMYSDTKIGIINDINYNEYENMYPPSASRTRNNNYNEYLNNMNNGTLPFPQPLLMDITLTYPNGTNVSNIASDYQQIPPPVAMNCIPTQTKTKQTLSMNTNPNTMMMHGINNMNNCMQCADCLQYMSKISELLKVNGDLNRDSMEIKQINMKYSAERDHWKSQYQQLLQQYQQLLRQNNELLQQKQDCNSAEEEMQEMEMEVMSVSCNKTDKNIVSPSDNSHITQPQIPLDDLAKTPKELLFCSNITPFAVDNNGMNGFQFPNENKNKNGKCTVSVAASVAMSVCSNEVNRHGYLQQFNQNQNQNNWNM